MKNLGKNFLIVFLIFLVVASLFSIYLNPSEQKTELDITSMIGKINQGQVQSIKVIDNKLELTLTDGSLAKVRKEPTESLGELLKNYQVDLEKLGLIKIAVEQNSNIHFLLASLLPFLIP